MRSETVNGVKNDLYFRRNEHETKRMCSERRLQMTDLIKRQTCRVLMQQSVINSGFLRVWKPFMTKETLARQSSSWEHSTDVIGTAWLQRLERWKTPKRRCGRKSCRCGFHVLLQARQDGWQPLIKRRRRHESAAFDAQSQAKNWECCWSRICCCNSALNSVRKLFLFGGVFPMTRF